MKRLITVMLLLFIPTANADSDETLKHRTKPYIEININGLEEIAAPLQGLTNAVEQLSRSEKLSAADQDKIMQITGELHKFSAHLDSTIDKTRDKVSNIQEEISASLQHMILLATIAFFAVIAFICGAIVLLFKWQISPLASSTLTTINDVSSTLDKLSATADFIAQHNTNNGVHRRFARRNTRIH